MRASVQITLAYVRRCVTARVQKQRERDGGERGEVDDVSFDYTPLHGAYGARLQIAFASARSSYTHVSVFSACKSVVYLLSLFFFL